MAGNNSTSDPVEMTPTRSTATIASTAVLGTVENKVTWPGRAGRKKSAVKWVIKLDRHTQEEINEFVEMRSPAYYEKKYEERQKKRRSEEEEKRWRAEEEEKKRKSEEEKKRKSDEEKKRKSDEEKKNKKQKPKTTRRSKGKEKVDETDNTREEKINDDTEYVSLPFIPITEYEVIEID